MADENTAKEIPKKVEKSDIAKREEATLAFWKEHTIFKKTLEKESPKGEFIFYDGPPFATGLPHHGHMLPGTMKDVIPRFKTMQGYHVPRRWGWDTHGLPVENLVEKELGLKSKKDIEEYGIEKFNEAARASVLRYDADWKEIVPRTGRFIDFDNAYLTMQPSYSESIWWSFKTLYDKNLIYNGFKSMLYCPHCGTTLSNFEVAQGYKDITDLSVYAKFELEESPSTSSGQAKTFVVAWTTTPWTLPGNAALAVGKDIAYVKLEHENNFYILAKERLVALKEKILKDKELKIVGEMLGKDLVGKKYKPVFDYYVHVDVKNKENAWKIVAADFVTTTDGTGVVHIAPAFGEDDYALSLKENLPFIQHVDTEGKFKKEVLDFAGQLVKPKDDVQKADIEIVKYLAGRGLLFAKEKFIHSYPHCWRCDTPLLNYATSSWFLKVTSLKDKLVSENKKVKWVPPEIGEGRFGKWLEGARDWSISRSRYWGAPLPVWICKDCGKTEVIGSVKDIKAKTKRNEYVTLRHGEAQSNKSDIVSCSLDLKNNLTERGIKQIEEAATTLENNHIDIIVCSDLTRTKETAEIVAKHLHIPTADIVFDARLREYNFGDFEGTSRTKWHAYWSTQPWEEIEKKVPGGESPADIRNRIFAALKEIDEKYHNKKILIISHQDPISYMQSLAEGDNIATISKNKWKQYEVQNAEARPLDFARIPRNKNLELDQHRPYIDAITWNCDCGGKHERVKDVFDTWYESGSMPYASIHYPFENKQLIDSNLRFPADFIAEGQDQTRGWFYTMLVLSVGLFDQAPYKNVVVNGIVLAEDGQKMSKRLKNYPELNLVFDTFGADALRYFLMASPAVHAEDVSFSEKSLDEVVKKVISKLQNVYTFYSTYQSEEIQTGEGYDETRIKNVLDAWIISRLHELTETITTNLEQYELDRAAKPIVLFIDDLSTWYLRRSRDRFKGDDASDKQNALYTMRFVLRELSKLMAPFTPFIAEDIYQKVKHSTNKESVHLEDWPLGGKVDIKNIEAMAEVRLMVSLGLEARAKAGIKVRQPLASVFVGKEIPSDFAQLILDELNVKKIIVKLGLEGRVELDTQITPELKHEGQAREFIRAVQDARKKADFNPTDSAVLTVFTDENGKKCIDAYTSEISKTAQLSAIHFSDTNGEKIVIDDMEFVIRVEKSI